MKFCNKCGTQLTDETVFCSACGAKQDVEPNYSTTDVQNRDNNSDNSRLYSILSYIGILWLIGLFVKPEKNNPKVKFHVGQGMVLTIFSVALPIVLSILNKILVSIALYNFSLLAIIGTIMSVLNFGAWALSAAINIIGLVNVCQNKQKPLPIIGKLAFYK